VFRQNGRIVQFRPEFGRLYPQHLVIVLRSDVGVTLFAVQPAEGNQSLRAGMSCYPESASFAPSEYRIHNPDIEPTVRLKLRKNE
jgi:hypothetical protein